MANQTNADVLQELRCLKRDIPVQLTAAWVKSHQDKCDTKEARLNKIVDTLASQQHNKRGEWASGKTCHMLPRTQAQLMVRGERYTGSIDKNVQYRMYEKPAREYVLRKLNLTHCSELVDWPALRGLHKRLTWQR